MENILNYIQSGEHISQQIDNFTDKVWNEDCLDVMKRMPDNSIDAVVTDPPYGISFMNKRWDYNIPSVDVWKESLRVLKPGGHMLVACGTRTQHRMAINIEDAGFEIRDIIVWAYGSGFPKSLNISKAIDKELGCERDAGLERFKKAFLQANNHPTVKPLDLMRYICCLITPPNGILLDPFTGSGTTGIAATLEGFRFIGCEIDKEYCEIARLRIDHHKKPLFSY